MIAPRSVLLRCSLLQHVAACRSVSQRVAAGCSTKLITSLLQPLSHCVAACCSLSQRAGHGITAQASVFLAAPSAPPNVYIIHLCTYMSITRPHTCTCAYTYKYIYEYKYTYIYMYTRNKHMYEYRYTYTCMHTRNVGSLHYQRMSVYTDK